MGHKTELGRVAWTDVENAILVVPVGSCEQHGPHLPLDTDTVIAAALANNLVCRRSDCLVAPPIAITASGEHQGFAGTLSIGTDAMTDVVVELVRSADWATGVVFVNGHGGNHAAMTRATQILRDEHHNILAWWPKPPDADPHAGHTETSLMLALQPESVQMERATTGPTPSIEDLIRHGVKPLSDSGVLGDPTTATSTAGAQIFEQLTENLSRTVSEWCG